MRPEPNHRLDPYRVRKTRVMPESPDGANWGWFKRGEMAIISSGVPEPGSPGWPWEHVSVSFRDRTPTWEEMCWVKRMFWGDDETVIQIHPREADYVNAHSNCLHLWKKAGEVVELPPKKLIA